MSFLSHITRPWWRWFVIDALLAVLAPGALYAQGGDGPV